MRPSPSDREGLIDTSEGVADFMNEIANIPTNPPSLYMDIEGQKLAYDVNMALFQIRVASPQLTRTVVLDIEKLGAKAFETGGRKGTTLRNILESRTIAKVFHCVSNDQAALKGLPGIDMQNVEDTQDLENAFRQIKIGTQQVGHHDCIRKYVANTNKDKEVWLRSKVDGKEKWHRKTIIFHKRPICHTIWLYVTTDVECLPALARPHPLTAPSRTNKSKREFFHRHTEAKWLEAAAVFTAAKLVKHQQPSSGIGGKRRNRNTTHTKLDRIAVQKMGRDELETAYKQAHGDVQGLTRRNVELEAEIQRLRRGVSTATSSKWRKGCCFW